MNQNYIIKNKQNVNYNGSNGFTFEVYEEDGNANHFIGKSFIKTSAKSISDKKCLESYFEEN